MKTCLIWLAFICTVLAIGIYLLLPGLNLPKTQEMKETVFFIGMVFGAPLGWVLGFYLIGPWFGRSKGRRLFSVVSAIVAMAGMMVLMPDDQFIKWLGIAAIGVGTIWIVLGGHKEGDEKEDPKDVEMLWIDNSQSKMDVKVRKATDYYSKNYGSSANLVLCNPTDFDKKARIPGVEIRPSKNIQQGCLQVGRGGGTK